VTRVRLDQLGPKARAQVLGALDEQPKPKRSRGKRGSVKGGKWRCRACGETFTAWARAERHADDAGHHRLEVVLGGGRGD
jgi:hypothetical protein